MDSDTTKIPDGDELSPEELETVTGAKLKPPPTIEPDACKETDDSGMMGCPG